MKKKFNDISKSELTINVVMARISTINDDLEEAIFVANIEERTSKDLRDIARIIHSILKP